MLKRIFEDETLRTIFVSLGSFFSFWFGNFSLPVQMILMLIALDFITGLTKGYLTKQLSSEIGSKGLIKKASIFVVLIIGIMSDRLLQTNDIIRTMICYFYIFNEIISILENLVEIGVPIPKKLVEALLKVKHLGGDTIQDVNELKEETVKDVPADTSTDTSNINSNGSDV